MTQPTHPIARTLLDRCREWATDLRGVDPRFSCFSIGSIFRTDFDPSRSDIDIMLVVDSGLTPTLNDTLDLIKSASTAVAGLASYINTDELRSIPISQSLYLTREIEANIHRSGEPSYYQVTEFVPLTRPERGYDPSVAAGGSNDALPHPSVVNAISAAQQVRHMYLQPSGLANQTRKLWEKLFHHLRNLLRAAGHIEYIHRVPSRELILDLLISHYPDSGLPVGKLYQSLKSGQGAPQLTSDFCLQSYEALSRLAWRIDGERGKVWTYVETRH